MRIRIMPFVKILLLIVFLLIAVVTIWKVSAQSQLPVQTGCVFCDEKENLELRALKAEFQVLQSQIQTALENHNRQVSDFVDRTLKHHDHPKFHWNPTQYVFEADKAPETDKGGKK